MRFSGRGTTGRAGKLSMRDMLIARPLHAVRQHLEGIDSPTLSQPVSRILIAGILVDSSLLNPRELLETLTARQKYQRAHEQAHIDDDRHAYNRPAHHLASM